MGRSPTGDVAPPSIGFTTDRMVRSLTTAEVLCRSLRVRKNPHLEHVDDHRVVAVAPKDVTATRRSTTSIQRRSSPTVGGSS